MEIDFKKNKETFIELLRSTNREGVEGMIEDLEKIGFFSAPASAGHHLNVEGGLVQHSLNTCRAALMVWEGMKKLEPSLEGEVKRDSVIIASLLHDICKSDIYVRTVKKRKNSIGVWEDVEGYKVTYKSFPMGHGEKSLVLALYSGMELTDAEMLAIRWHMGAWGVNMSSFEDQRNYDASRILYPLVTIIQTADGLAAAILERTQEAIDEL
ncbi:MAG: HD family phosphohydrolase [Phocaeicola sp.]|nr:HD family phosphohydrolase [Phocaeicola sp.]